MLGKKNQNSKKKLCAGIGNFKVMGRRINYALPMIQLLIRGWTVRISSLSSSPPPPAAAPKFPE